MEESKREIEQLHRERGRHSVPIKLLYAVDREAFSKTVVTLKKVCGCLSESKWERDRAREVERDRQYPPQKTEREKDCIVNLQCHFGVVIWWPCHWQISLFSRTRSVCQILSGMIRGAALTASLPFSLIYKHWQKWHGPGYALSNWPSSKFTPHNSWYFHSTSCHSIIKYIVSYQ